MLVEKGQIKARIHDLLNRHGDIYSLKMATFFDSDKREKDVLREGAKYLIKFLKNIAIDTDLKHSKYEDSDLISWHILYKREIENYLPLSVIASYYTDSKVICNQLSQYSADDLDYIDMENAFKELDTKSVFPDLFLEENWRKNLLEERCKHHFVEIETPNHILEPVSEIEVLLLKLVKII